VPLLCIIVVHHHGIQTKDNPQWLYNMKPPQKQLQQNSAEQETTGKQNSSEKPLHPMGRKHILRRRLNTASIPLILFQRVKVDQMPTCAIHKEAEKLLEDLGDLLTLAALSYLRDLENTKIPFIMSPNSKTGGIENENIDADS
jgi:hypothetical protein